MTVYVWLLLSSISALRYRSTLLIVGLEIRAESHRLVGTQDVFFCSSALWSSISDAPSEIIAGLSIGTGAVCLRY